MRTIVIRIKTDSEEQINWIKYDLMQEISCCSAYFYTEDAIVEEEKHGKWEDVETDDNEWVCHKCSECGHEAYNYTGEILMNEWNFCPWCGAKMERSENDPYR